VSYSYSFTYLYRPRGTAPSHNPINNQPGTGAHPTRGGPGCSPPPNPQNRNLKATDFVDIKISKVLPDFPFSQNQPVKSADDQYITILRNKLIKLKNKKIGHCD
jgi:hypothetical protein